MTAEMAPTVTLVVELISVDAAAECTLRQGAGRNATWQVATRAKDDAETPIVQGLRRGARTRNTPCSPSSYESEHRHPLRRNRHYYVELHRLRWLPIG